MLFYTFTLCANALSFTTYKKKLKQAWSIETRKSDKYSTLAFVVGHIVTGVVKFIQKSRKADRAKNAMQHKYRERDKESNKETTDHKLKL